MKILIAADMEGITGVVHWDQVDSGHTEYARFRKLMTADVNAAVQGAFDGGAEAVVVSDGHGSGRNILIEELDLRARLNCGGPSPFSMVQGIDTGVGAAMFIGYHARVGSQNGVLDHTWSSTAVADVWLNGRMVGEIGLNGAVCGHFGVPVMLISGDQTACAEAIELFGAVETAIVKRASGRMAAECLPPEAAQRLIYEASRRAVQRLSSGQGTQPLQFQHPLTLAIRWVTSDMADRVLLLPNVQRREGRLVEFAAEDVPAAYRTVRAAVTLANA
jgi:D-amino peptidase